MSERDNILGRIREALTVPAPKPGGHDKGKPGPETVDRNHNRFLPAFGANFDAQVKQFATHAADLKADFYCVQDGAELNARLADLRQLEGWKKVASHNGNLTDPACRALGLPVVLTDAGYQVADMESCDAGISECDVLVAQTGTVVVTSRTSGGRALSVLPPHHVVIARREQLLGSLPDAFQAIKARYGSNYPSMISFITGPSRTGDIERILVLGAHGPKKLTIFLLMG